MNETKFKKQRQEEAREKFGQDWEIQTNISQVGELEGESIWLGWNRNIWDSQIESVSMHHTHNSLRNKGGLNIHLTIFYRKNKEEEREDLWTVIEDLHNSIGGKNGP